MKTIKFTIMALIFVLSCTTSRDEGDESTSEESSSDASSGSGESDGSDDGTPPGESDGAESESSGCTGTSGESDGGEVHGAVNGWPDVYLFRPLEAWSMHEGESITLVARVRDPDDNMDHVRLLTFGGIDMGTFERTSNEQFEFKLSWETMSAFGLSENTSTFEWKFTAEAYDAEGAMAVAFTPMWISCDMGEVFCNGLCWPADDSCEG